MDFEAGRVKPYTVFDVQAGQRLIRRDAIELSARAAVLNLTDARYAFNFGNPFSGTHFGAAAHASGSTSAGHAVRPTPCGDRQRRCIPHLARRAIPRK